MSCHCRHFLTVHLTLHLFLFSYLNIYALKLLSCYLPLSCNSFRTPLIGESRICFNTAISYQLFENLTKSRLIIDGCTQYALQDFIHVSPTTSVCSFQILQFLIGA